MGQSLEYTPEIEVIENGWIYSLKVHLNIVALFGTYNTDLARLLIVGNKVTD